eukprot:1392428-Amorphochlora_amoeboformis.AAC.1
MRRYSTSLRTDISRGFKLNTGGYIGGRAWTASLSKVSSRSPQGHYRDSNHGSPLSRVRKTMAKILVLTGLWLCLTHLYPKSLSASRILPQNRPATSSVRSPRRHIRLFREIWPGSSGRGREVGRGMVEGRVGQRVRALET